MSAKRSSRKNDWATIGGMIAKKFGVKKNRRQGNSFFALLLALIGILIAGFSSTFLLHEEDKTANLDGKISIHMIDVGQGDAILVRSPDGKNMLIDAGEFETLPKVEAYLNKLNVKKIDVLVATHPHSDHIGAMPEIVRDFEIGEIYMPRVPSNQISTKTYEMMLKEIAQKGMKIKSARGGEKIDFSPNVDVNILAPNAEQYESLNNYSAVLKINYGYNSFLLTGDMESVEEKEILDEEIKSDVIKVGHHGSGTSSTTKFLSKVQPKYGLISVGKDNKYGHPHQNIIQRYENDFNVQLYRTDQSGTVIVLSDGKNLEFITEK